MTAVYPSEIYEERETENLPGIVYDENKKQNLFSEDFQRHGEEIISLETTLGINPQGDSETVGDRLSDTDTLINAESLTTNKIIKWNGSKFTDSIIYDNGTRVGIGTDAPEVALDVVGDWMGQDRKLDYAAKSFAILQGHYRSIEEPMVVFRGLSNSTQNIFYFGGGITSYNAATEIRFYTAPDNVTLTGTQRMIIYPNGNVGIGISAPTAYLHLKAGTASGGTAPLKYTSGVLNTNPAVGAVEFVTDDLFFTITTGTARKAFILDNGTRLTSGKIPVATTNGRLIDVTPQTELTDELTSITHTAPSTPDYAIQDLIDSSAGSCFGFATKDEGNTALSVISNLQTRVNELETKLVALGLLADTD